MIIKTPMVPGRRYRVKLDDCCINGVLEGVFIEYIQDASEPASEDYPWKFARFDFGTIGPHWGAWEIEEAV